MHPLPTPPAPRRFVSPMPGSPVLPGAGLPNERQARIAARRSFVELKLAFIEAAGVLDGARADWLRWQVRQAQDPLDLWLLRGAVFEALGRGRAPMRLALQRALDAVFPSSEDAESSLPPMFL